MDGANRAAFDDERITLTEYALNLTKWILRLPKRQIVQDENGAVIARSESFYDDETFAGNNFGSVTLGNLTLRRDWIDPSNAAAYVKAVRARYDVYGNSVMVLDPLSDGAGHANQGHLRELTYDDAFRCYPTRETIHVGNGRPALVFQAAYDAGLGTMLSSTDFNGNTTTYGYDSLARLTTLIKPYDTAAFPTAEYHYALAVPVPLEHGLGSGEGFVNYVETRQLDRAPDTLGTKRDHYLISRQFSDGLGRSLMTRLEAEPASGQTTPRVVVGGAVLFNARQKPVQTLNPFFTKQTGTLDQLLDFENIEAPAWRGQFHQNGSLVALPLAAAHQSRTEYDATLRPRQTSNADGTQSRIEYEPLVTRIFDENDVDTTSPHFNTPLVHTSDGLGRLIRVDELVQLNDDGTPAGRINTWTTRYEYDLNDCLTRLVDSQNNVKVMRYDGLKRKTFMNDPDAGISTSAFDDASNVSETLDAKHQRITYAYDGANRILTVDYHDENSTEFSYRRSPDVTYHYDEPVGPVDQGDGTGALPRNTKGALAFVDDASGEEHTSFDARGRVEWTVKRIRDPAFGSPSTNRVPLTSYRTAFEYDSLDRVARMIYPDNDQVTYRYNARNLLERITGGPSGDIIPAISYLPSAQPDRCDYGNGVRSTYTYDARRRLTQLATLNPQRSTELVRFGYDFDAVSNLKAIHDQRASATVPLTDKRRNSQTFSYDDLYRLTRVQYNLPTPSPENGGRIDYRYDRLGNLLAQASDIVHLEKGSSITDLGTLAYGGAAGRSNRVGRQANDPPGPHALTRISNPKSPIPDRDYPYDANGNMTQLDGMVCTWDFLDRLVAVEDETMRAEYTYDFTDRRITKRVQPKASSVPNGAPTPGCEPTTTIYVGKHFEVREHDQPTKYIFNGGTRVARVIGSLSNNSRLQRFRLHPGWNPLSLAVTANNLGAQLRRTASESPSVVTSTYFWNPHTGNYSLTPPEPAPAGTVLWVKAATNAAVSVTGTYADPVRRQLAPGATYVSGTGLEAWSASFPPTMLAWNFSAPTARWRAQLNQDLSFVSDLPRTLAPGTALFLIANASAELEVPEPALRIRYYHQDHLGSSSVMTDAQGGLVEEAAFYPFGEARHEHRLRQIEESYKFTQKERDQESGLHYFEARYLAGRWARFISPDPKFKHPDRLDAKSRASHLSAPQELNLYSYVENRPLLFIDPTGLEKRSLIIVGAGHTELRRDTTRNSKIVVTDEIFKAGVQGMFKNGPMKGHTVVYKEVTTAREMVALIRSGNWDTVGYFGHGLLNAPEIDPGHVGGNDSARGQRLSEQGLASALNGRVKSVVLMGCTAGASGLARQLSADLPGVRVSGSFDYLDVVWLLRQEPGKPLLNNMSPSNPLNNYRNGKELDANGKPAPTRRREYGDRTGDANGELPRGGSDLPTGRVPQ